MEAIKILSGRSESVRRKIFTADLWHGPIRETGMPPRDPDCPCCGRRDFHMAERPPCAGQLMRPQRGADSRTAATDQILRNLPCGLRVSAACAATNSRCGSPAGNMRSPCFPTAAPSSRARPTSALRAASTQGTSAIEEYRLSSARHQITRMSAPPDSSGAAARRLRLTIWFRPENCIPTKYP